MAVEDLTPFPKGVSGNPKGRPKGTKNTKTILERFLNVQMKQTNPFTKLEEDLSVQELMNLVQIKRALDGDLGAFKELTDRLEGKLVNNTDIKSDGKAIEPTVIKVGYSKKDED